MHEELAPAMESGMRYSGVRRYRPIAFWIAPVDLSLATSPLLLVLALLGAGALTWWTYSRTTPSVTGGRRLLLAGLRFVALFVVLLLLFDPVFRRIERNEEPPLLAVLFDVSESLTTDPEVGTGAPPSAALTEALAGLPGDDALRLYTFASDAEPLRDASPDSLQFDGERTDIARALQRIERDFDGRNLRGVLLLSDGRYNTGRNPLYLAERYRVPIYTAVVGDTTTQQDVRIGRVVTNDVAYVGSQLPVQVGVRASGFANERATVVLTENGQTVASEAITLPADGLEVTTELLVTPTVAGLRRYTVGVSRQPEEATYRNNTETVAVRVLDTKRQVLLVSGAPGPDLTALRTLLETDPNIELTPRTQRAPGQFYEGTLPADLSAFDAVVLAGYPSRAADGATTTRLAAAIEAGLPALFVLARQTDLMTLGRAFGDVLPATPEVVRSGVDEAGLVLTPAGSTHPILQIPGVPPSALGSLP
ncbi:MAG: VWA domain-containing protein, partial [Rhodothermaceae bacterium]|nr:VWA domain-containing protein [Rhodothermaceae bacterium]